jgi:hypothetical protein
MRNDRIPARRRGAGLAAALVLAAAAASCAGCLGYRLGSSLPPGIRSVHVPPFKNDTGEPMLENDTTRAAINELRKDGTLKIADAAGADAVLRVTLTRCALEPLRYEPGSRRTVREYRIALRAAVRLERQSTGEALMERSVKGEGTFVVEGDLASAKRDALPDAARDLAHNIVECVVEYW